MVAITDGRCFVMISGVSPGHVLKKFFFIAAANVDLTGEKQAACKYLASSVCVYFFLIITEIDGLLGSICALQYS